MSKKSTTLNPDDPPETTAEFWRGAKIRECMQPVGIVGKKKAKTGSAVVVNPRKMAGAVNTKAKNIRAAKAKPRKKTSEAA